MSEPWREALRLFDADLRRRGAAERTRRAYGTDAAELARVGDGERPRSGGRQLPGAAPLGRPAVAEGRRAAHDGAQARLAALAVPQPGRARPDRREPGRPRAAPRLPQTLPRTLKPDDVARLLDRIPASTPLEQRDRALFELAYASGLRAEELVDLDVASIEFDAEQVRVEGKGVQDPLRAHGRAGAAGAGAPTSSARGRR